MTIPNASYADRLRREEAASLRRHADLCEERSKTHPHPDVRAAHARLVVKFRAKAEEKEKT